MSVNACRRDLPVAKPTCMPSTITMALSTSIPIAIMKAPSDTLCSVPPTLPSTVKVQSTVSNRLMPMIIPLRIPMKNIRMMSTMAMDSIKFMANEPRALFT